MRMRLSKKQKKVEESLKILELLGLPVEQRNERSALCLLALLDLTPIKDWKDSTDPLIGVTPIMNWMKANYGKEYAPNTRETIRRQTLHQFVEAGVARYNPDCPSRAVNSPKAVYQISAASFALLKRFEDAEWENALSKYLEEIPTLVEKYAKERKCNMITIEIQDKHALSLSPGEHNQLTKSVIDDFMPRFVEGGVPLYVGDTGNKWVYNDEDALASIGVKIPKHGKMPDVIIHDKRRGWLILVESVTSHGPVDSKRHSELTELFGGAISE